MIKLLIRWLFWLVFIGAAFYLGLALTTQGLPLHSFLWPQHFSNTYRAEYILLFIFVVCPAFRAWHRVDKWTRS